MQLSRLGACFALLILAVGIVMPTEAVESEQPNGTNAEAAQETSSFTEKLSEYVDVGDWQISIAMGLGNRTSPLYGTQDQRLLIVPTFSVYGEKFYFDNGSLGYTFTENQTYSVSLVTELNPINAQYFDIHPANLVLGSEGFDNKVPVRPASPSTDEGAIPPGLSDFDWEAFFGINQPERISVEKPDWSIDGGVRFSWFISDHQLLTAQLFRDISGVHDGHRLELEWSETTPITVSEQFRQSLLDDWTVQLRVGLSIYDQKSTQYYFGLDRRHTDNPDYHYYTDQSINPHFSVFLTRPLAENWRAVAFFKYLQLHNEIYQSPRTEDRAITTYFIGMAYDF